MNIVIDVTQRSVPATYDNYVMDMDVDGVKVELGLWDTAGDPKYCHLRPLLYPKSHVILICFSVDSPSSLEHAQNQVEYCLDLVYLN
jgi:Ras homolog gene family, member A